MKNLERRSWVKIFAASSVVLLTLAIYRPVHQFDMLVYDDLEHIVYNPYLTTESGLDRWRDIWTKPYFDLYVPLTYSLWSLAFDSTTEPEARRGDPLNLARNQDLARTLHGMNLVIHVGNVVLVLCILQAMGLSVFGATLGSLVFALHPLQVESVAWISEFRGVLATNLGLISLWIWFSVMSRRSEPVTKIRNPGVLTWLEITSCCLFVLSLLSKPSLVVLPAFAVLCVRCFTSCSWKRIFKHIVPWALVVLLAIVLTLYLQKDLLPLWPWWQRILVAGDALGFYTVKLFWPQILLIDYSRRPDFGMTLQTVAAATVWIVAALLTYFARRSPSSLLAGGLWFFGLSSQLGLLPSLYQSISTVADRYVYLGMLGPALGLGAAWSYGARAWSGWTKYLGGFLVIAALSLMVVKTAEQLQVWRTSDALFTYTLRHNPKSYTSLHGLGDLASVKPDPRSAESYYREAIAVRPEFAQGYASLGKVLLEQGRVEEARDALSQSLAIHADNSSARLNLGVSLQRLRNYDAALREYLAIMAVTNHPLAYFNAGTIYMQKHAWSEAETSFLKALELNPNLYQAHIHLGQVYERLGRSELRDQHLRAAQLLQSGKP